MLFFGREMEINTRNYGKITIQIDNRSRFGNCYYAISRYKDIEISGIIDSNGKEIVPFDNAILSETIIAKNMEDYCFGFKYPDSEILNYYHIKCKNKDTKLVLRTNRFDEVPLSIRMIDNNDNYWIWETAAEHPQYAIYDYKNTKVVSNFFDTLDFLDYDSPYHMAYFEVEVFSNLEYEDGTVETVVHTNLCGFLDDECNISSEILDTESEVIYNSYMYGPTTLDKRFMQLTEALKQKYLEEYYKKEEDVNDILNYLYNSPNTSDKIEYKCKRKIVEFKPRKKV